MTTLLLALAIACQDGEPASLYREIIKHPTGNNALEEFLQAADIVRSDRFKAVGSKVSLVRGVPGFLAAQREFDAASGDVEKLIAAGLDKPYFDPRTIDEDTAFSELSTYKMIVRVLVAKARVSFAAGRPSAATDQLLLALRFGDKIGQGPTVISYLVGIAATSIALSEFHSSLASIPVSKLAQVRKVAEDCKSSRWLAAVVTAERNYTVSRIALVTKNPLVLRDESSGEEANQMLERTAKLSPAERDQLAADFERAIVARTTKFQQILESREKLWDELIPSLEPKIGDPLTAFWVEFYSGVIGKPLLFNECKRRTQLRLLALSAKIEAVRWETGALPASLEALEEPAATTDPLSELPFFYRPSGDSYELYSQGSLGSGRIDMVYRRGKTVDDGASGWKIKPSQN